MKRNNEFLKILKKRITYDEAIRYSSDLIKIVAVTCLALGINGCAGMIDNAVRLEIEPSEQTIEFIDTWEIDKNKIYDSTLSWATQTYNSSINVIDMKDRDAGLVSIHALFDVPVSFVLLPCNYSLQIRVKDKKTKMTFVIHEMATQIRGSYPPKNSMESVRSYFRHLHETYQTAIKNQTKADDF
ncbi:MAG: DUF4468 domain-containing protein [Methylovulum sp.]|nr:DUF4468 domain-containing protein [Methylovulum sp.]